MSVIKLALSEGKVAEVQRRILNCFRTVTRTEVEQDKAGDATRLYGRILHTKKASAESAAVVRRRVGVGGSYSSSSARYAKVEVSYFRLMYVATTDNQVLCYVCLCLCVYVCMCVGVALYFY